MHARKDRRILEEKRHGGCAEARERTAAQRETVSGRKGPQASVAFSGHNPRRTRRAQHGIFGERSFCRLLNLRNQPDNSIVRVDTDRFSLTKPGKKFAIVDGLLSERRFSHSVSCAIALDHVDDGLVCDHAANMMGNNPFVNGQ